jgi:hypothetical protein
MPSHGVMTQSQTIRYLTIRKSLTRQIQNFDLAGGQTREFRGAGC